MKPVVFSSHLADEPVLVELRRAYRHMGDRPIDDIRTLRAGNSERLNGPLVRRALPANVRSHSFGGVPGEWIEPEDSSTDLVVLYCHGGAYVRGSLQQGRPMASALAHGIRGRAASVAWAQAPERCFPAPIEDVITAYRALIDSGISPRSIVMAGDSAGGAIVIAAMVALRAAGVDLPLACVSISPWADLTLTGASWCQNKKQDIVGPQYVGSAARMYLNGADPRDPRGSPIYADLSGLPPLLIVVGEKEVLLSDALALASRAEQAGVPVVVHAYSDMIHVFPMFTLHSGKEALERAAAFILEQRGA